MSAQFSIEITEASGIGEAKRRAAAVARDQGFDEDASGRVSIVATELASNMVKHAGGGQLVVGRLGSPATPGIELLALDGGPGMTNIGESLRDGFSTAGSPGTGLGAVRRQSSLFDLYAPPGAGTAVLSRMWVHGREPEDGHPLVIGAVCLALPGERECGDAWAVRQMDGRAVVLVADGLGHGPEAAHAATLAVEVLERRVTEHAAPLVRAIDDALRGTRGAAVAVAEVLPAAGTVEYAGLGNITARLHGDVAPRHLVSANGIAGMTGGTPHSFSAPWPANGLLIMWSDGLGTHWDLSDRPGLGSRHPSLIAGVLVRDHRRKRDDVTVVVATSAALREASR